MRNQIHESRGSGADSSSNDSGSLERDRDPASQGARSDCLQNWIAMMFRNYGRRSWRSRSVRRELGRTSKRSVRIASGVFHSGSLVVIVGTVNIAVSVLRWDDDTDTEIGTTLAPSPVGPGAFRVVTAIEKLAHGVKSSFETCIRCIIR